MAVDRPTFSESWYRVANLRPRLRAFVQVQRQRYRGRIWFVLQDPSNDKFFRLDESAYHFVGLLDGDRTVSATWELANEHLGDAAPTQNEAIQLLGQLYSANLIQAELPADAAGMFERYRKRVRREVGGYFMNLLFARIPVLDPDRMLDRWVPVVSWVFSPIGAALWVVLMAMGLWTIAGRTEQLVLAASGTLSPNNLVWLYASMVVIKALHELGHGFACKKFGLLEQTGGEVHTIGIMLLVLMPVPYMDASSAWALRSKWRRIIISAAGMYVEMAIAAIAAMVWARTAEGSATNAIAFNLMFIASVSTILFNGNPLIRFDGYYILSDLIEAPNLNQRSKDFLYYLIKKYIYGVRNPRNPAHGRRERSWMMTYAIASFAYRIFIGVVIILYVANQLFFIGVLLAIGALCGWLVVPIGKMFKYLMTNPELGRVRARALLTTTGFCAAMLLALGIIPAPDHSRAEGLIEPRHYTSVHAAVDGFVLRCLETETLVTEHNVPLVEARNFELETEQRQLQAKKQLFLSRYRKARIQEVAAAQRITRQIIALEEQIHRIDQQLSDLNLAAPQAGTFVAFDIERSLGSFLKRGDPIGMVATLDDLVIRVVADQYLGPRIVPDISAGQKVQIRVRRRPDLEFTGQIETVLRASHQRLPSPALGFSAGGSTAIKTDDEQGTEAAEPFFEIMVCPDNGHRGDLTLLPGQRVVVRFAHEPMPLLGQGWRALRQLVQNRLRI